MYTKDTNNKHKEYENIRNRNLSDGDLSDDFQKVREKMGETRDALSQTASHAKKRAEQLLQNSLHDLKDRTLDLQENIITYVKGNPVKSISFAIVAGLIFSKLFRK